MNGSVPVGRRYARVKEVAAFLGLNPETVRRKARAGEFPGARLGGRGMQMMIPWADVEAYLAKRRPREGEATIREVAEMLSLHPATVTGLFRSGAFRTAYETDYKNQPNHIRIPLTDVEDYRKKQPRVNR